MRAVLAPVGCLLVLGLVSGCVSDDPKDGGTVTVTVPPSAPPTTASTTGTPAGSASASATPSAVATVLPGRCASLLADFTVSNALGGLDLGTTAYVVGVPDRTIGRLSTINCRYGITGTGAAQKAKIEIGVSLYGTAAQAAARITATTDDYVANGATPAEVPVPSTPAVTATVLSGGTPAGYTLPLLVVAADRRTIAVTVDPATVTTPPAAQAAVTLAALAIQRTAT